MIQNERINCKTAAQHTLNTAALLTDQNQSSKLLKNGSKTRKKTTIKVKTPERTWITTSSMDDNSLCEKDETKAAQIHNTQSHNQTVVQNKSKLSHLPTNVELDIRVQYNQLRRRAAKQQKEKQSAKNDTRNCSANSHFRRHRNINDIKYAQRQNSAGIVRLHRGPSHVRQTFLHSPLSQTTSVISGGSSVIAAPSFPPSAVYSSGTSIASAGSVMSMQMPSAVESVTTVQRRTVPPTIVRPRITLKPVVSVSLVQESEPGMVTVSSIPSPSVQVISSGSSSIISVASGPVGFVNTPFVTSSNSIGGLTTSSAPGPSILKNPKRKRSKKRRGGSSRSTSRGSKRRKKPRRKRSSSRRGRGSKPRRRRSGSRSDRSGSRNRRKRRGNQGSSGSRRRGGRRGPSRSGSRRRGGRRRQSRSGSRRRGGRRRPRSGSRQRRRRRGSRSRNRNKSNSESRSHKQRYLSNNSNSSVARVRSKNKKRPSNNYHRPGPLSSSSVVAPTKPIIKKTKEKRNISKHNDREKSVKRLNSTESIKLSEFAPRVKSALTKRSDSKRPTESD